MPTVRALAAATALAVSTPPSPPAPSEAGPRTRSGGTGKTVVVATHDSWAMSKKVLAEFTRKTGYTVKVEPNGDAGQLTNKLVLTKGSPIADLTYGIDNTFASRAVDEGVLADYTPKHLASSASSYALSDPADAAQLTPGRLRRRLRQRRRRVVPQARRHPAAHARRPDDAAVQGALRHPRRGHLVTGAGVPARHHREVRRRLAGVLEAADGQRHQADRGLVGRLRGRLHRRRGRRRPADRAVLRLLAAVHDPQGRVPADHQRLLDTCFRQVEYAGVLKGADEPRRRARRSSTSWSSGPSRRRCPTTCTSSRSTPARRCRRRGRRFAKIAPHPFTVPPAEIAKNRDAWLREWGDLTSR